ncbi:MAG: Rho termination factor N-terminal domain-containing protein, partial [Caloramator sp.]|nr:Rho termination factor N-terminal domain-containing protein [Caloramator sp.]
MDFEELKGKTLDELRELGKELGIKSVTRFRKSELIEEILKLQEENKDKKEANEDIPIIIPEVEKELEEIKLHDIDEDKRNRLQELLVDSDTVEGIFELIENQSYGFLRLDNYQQGPRDVYVSPSQIRKFNLRTGDKVKGKARIPNETEKYRALLYLQEINGLPPEKIQGRKAFENLTPIYPTKRLTLETSGNELATRLIDILAPIGRGQRGLIVAPPKAGKTVLLKKIANAITRNHPDVELIVLLIDERPEEVTDMQRSIQGEVVYSTFDE